MSSYIMLIHNKYVILQKIIKPKIKNKKQGKSNNNILDINDLKHRWHIYKQSDIEYSVLLNQVCTYMSVLMYTISYINVLRYLHTL